MRRLFPFLLVGLILFCDIFLKAYVDASFAPNSPIGGVSVFRDWWGVDFSVIHVVNRGAAWGIFASFQSSLLYVRVVISLLLGSYILLGNASSFQKKCLSLVLVGACGNILDYFLYGHVVDMFYFTFWGHSFPVFNIADSSIFIGVFLLGVENVRRSFSNRAMRS